MYYCQHDPNKRCMCTPKLTDAVAVGKSSTVVKTFYSARDIFSSISYFLGYSLNLI